MTEYNIAIHQTRLSAVVCGNVRNLFVPLIDHLIQSGLSVELVAKSLEAPSLEKQIEWGNLTHVQSVNSVTDLETHKYVFILIRLEGNEWSRVEKILTKTTPQQKTTLVFTHPPETEEAQKLFSEFQHRLYELVQPRKLNLRVVVLYDLYGPQIELSTVTLIDQILKAPQRGVLNLNTSEESLLYPLHVDDALEAITRATFVRGSANKIYEIGGEPITLLNLVYKVRLIANKDIELTTQPNSQSIRTKQLLDLVKLNWQELSWQPKTDLTKGLEEVIRLPEPKPQVQPVQPVIPSAPTLPASRQPFLRTEVIQPSPISPVESIPTPEPIQQDVSLPLVEPPPTAAPKVFAISHQAVSSDTKTPRPPSPPAESRPTKVKPKLSFKLPKFTLKKKRLFLIATIALIFTLYTLLHPVALFTWRVWRINTQIEEIKTLISATNFTAALEEISALETQSQLIQIDLQTYQPLLKLLLSDDKLEHINDLASLSVHLSAASRAVSQSADHASVLVQLLTDQTEGNITNTILNARTAITEAYHQLSLAETQLGESSDLADVQFLQIGSSIEKIANQLPQVRSYLEQSEQLLTVAPEIIGLNGRRTYLVLLQNNMELRPTGGFIGSYATLTFDKGELLDLQVEDVYTADGQLKGYVEPPAPIKAYLGEASWFLRDSNWDPDFPTSAETAAWFLNKEMGIDVQGVIGINLAVVQGLLEVLGPVELIDYNEVIDANNLYERAQYHSEINFFPGSTQKRDYLGSLTTHLHQELLNAEANTLYLVARKLVDLANQKQLTVALKEPQAQQIINELDWDGGVVDPECHIETTSTCITDYVGIREANLGVNKANLYVQRQVFDTVTIKSDEINHQLELVIENSSPGEAWPGGTYRNYIRFYVPLGSSLNSLSLNGQPIDLTTIDSLKEHNKQVYGLLVPVQPQSTASIKLDYSLAETLGDSKLIGYQYYFQKQPGTSSYDLSTNISYSKDFQIVRTDFVGQKQASNVVINNPVDSDKTYTIEFIRQN